MSNKPTQLPTGDGGVWWPRAVASGYYETGQTPRLGAVICFYDRRPGGSGHVAIVEEINETTGEITCSNSEYQGRYFFITTITPINGKYDWGTNYAFQGFIYNPFVSEEVKKNYLNWLKMKSRRINVKIKGR